MTLGTDRVRLDFNPNNNPQVQQIKEMTARLIDLCDSFKGHAVATAGAGVLSEKNRCLAIAMTGYEDAAMWAVKAATTPE